MLRMVAFVRPMVASLRPVSSILVAMGMVWRKPWSLHHARHMRPRHTHAQAMHRHTHGHTHRNTRHGHGSHQGCWLVHAHHHATVAVTLTMIVAALVEMEVGGAAVIAAVLHREAGPLSGTFRLLRLLLLVFVKVLPNTAHQYEKQAGAETEDQAVGVKRAAPLRSLLAVSLNTPTDREKERVSEQMSLFLQESLER